MTSKELTKLKELEKILSFSFQRFWSVSEQSFCLVNINQVVEICLPIINKLQSENVIQKFKDTNNLLHQKIANQNEIIKEMNILLNNR